MIRVIVSAFSIRLISHGLGFLGLLMLLTIFDASQFGRYSLVISFGLILSPAMNVELHLPMMLFMSHRSKADHRMQVTSGFSILLGTDPDNTKTDVKRKRDLSSLEFAASLRNSLIDPTEELGFDSTLHKN